VRKHVHGIDVLPPAWTNIDGSDFNVAGHQARSVGQTAIAASLASLEVIEDL
jgi:hypothetical protein